MEYSILSDIGSKRSTNQDYAGTYVNRAGYQLFLLADGMGGHKAGNVASKLTVEDLGKLWSETFFDAGTPEATLEIWLKIKFVMKMKILPALENLMNTKEWEQLLKPWLLKQECSFLPM